MAQHPRVQFAAIAPFLAEKMRFQTGAHVPAARGFGFHILAQGVTYLPNRIDEVLLWKNSLECNDNQAVFDKVLMDLASRAAAAEASHALSFHHLRALRAAGDASYESIASFRAVIFMPYE